MVEFGKCVNDRALAFETLKVQPKHESSLIVQSAEPVVVDTHWHLGARRRLWCSGEGCEGCNVTETRTMVYFVALVDRGKSHRPYLVEVTACQFQSVQLGVQWDEEVFGPGLMLRAFKPRSTSPLRLEVTGKSSVVREALRPVRIAISAAAKLAGVPPMKPGETVEDYRARAQRVAFELWSTASGQA